MITAIRIQNEAIQRNVVRLGLNLGGREGYGAGNFLRNMISNPGFEGGVYGSVVHVASATADGVSFAQAVWNTAWNNDAQGIGWPAGFWNGAKYEIVYGPAKGRAGSITKFALEGARNVFYFDTGGIAPQINDVVFLRKTFPPSSSGEARPGSAGKFSMYFPKAAQPYQSVFGKYFDSAWRDGDQSSGPLFIARGTWRVSFWAKCQDATGELEVIFQRGAIKFLDKKIAISSSWTCIDVRFEIPDGADAPSATTKDPLTFGIRLAQGSGVFLDDMFLGRDAAAGNDTAFTDACVARLKELRPGVLRFWGGQFGTTLEDQLADQYARRANGYSPKLRSATNWCYGLCDFLVLCKEVGADPWYVIPPTFSRADMDGLVAYLRAEGDHFNAVYIEYGNEAWGSAGGNDPFFGASMNGGIRLGRVAQDRLFPFIELPDEKIKLIVGGQYSTPQTQKDIALNCPSADSIALAPYFAGRLDTAFTTDDYYAMLARPEQDILHAQGKIKVARANAPGIAQSVYEINFHTTTGAVDIADRNNLVTGAFGALALPLHMLTYLREGISPLCAFGMTQYSFKLPTNNYARLWGMLRDLESTGRKRPTWLGVGAVNAAILDDMLRVTVTDSPVQTIPRRGELVADAQLPLIQAFAFLGPQYAANARRVSLVLFNLDMNAEHSVAIAWPGPLLDAQITKCCPDSLFDNNEYAETVRLVIEHPPLPLDAYTLAAHSLVIINGVYAPATLVGARLVGTAQTLDANIVLRVEDAPATLIALEKLGMTVSQ